MFLHFGFPIDLSLCICLITFQKKNLALLGDPRKSYVSHQGEALHYFISNLREDQINENNILVAQSSRGAKVEYIVSV